MKLIIKRIRKGEAPLVSMDIARIKTYLNSAKIPVQSIEMLDGYKVVVVTETAISEQDEDAIYNLLPIGYDIKQM